MRLAAVAVGSAILGSSVVLFSLAPPKAAPAAPLAPIAEVVGGEPNVKNLPPDAPTPVASPGPRRLPGSCSPCASAPLDAAKWREKLSDSKPPPGLWDRIGVLSLALQSPAAIAAALEREDDAERELAALLLNVASQRIAGCAPIAEGVGTATDVLDALDRMVATGRMGEAVPKSDLTVATAAARSLNEGSGEPAACRGPTEAATDRRAAGDP